MNARTTATVDVAGIDLALAIAAPDLDRTGREVAIATYRTLSAARPAPVAAIAASAGVGPATVERLLTQWGAVFRDEADDVIGFWGLAVSEMAHRLVLGGRDLFAWCAWDPLFLARIIGPLAVSTDDPITGETISYRLDREGRILDLSHPDSVLSFLRPDREWDDQVMATFCHHVLHFTGTGTAERWSADHEGSFVLGLDDAVELARRHSDRTFGEVLG